MKIIKQDKFFRLPKKGVLSYIFVVAAWCQTIKSLCNNDPVKTANERGYVLV